jgi:endonuclease-3
LYGESDSPTTVPSHDGGTYTLLIHLAESDVVEVGALGTCSLGAGWYAYTGSALGSGGFSRIDRHAELARGEREVRHWHVDYLLCHPASRLDTVRKTTGLDAECAIATAIDGEAVPDFGCSDCDCHSHLVYAPDRDSLLRSVERAHRNA